MPDRRGTPARLGVVALVAVLGAFAWLTRQPEAPIFVRAERLPLAGPWVAKLRALYLPPPEVEPPSPGPPEVVTIEADPRHLVREKVWIGEGATLHRRPDRAAPVVWRSTVYANVPVLESRGRWRRVIVRGRHGWVLSPERPPGEPPLGSDPTPPGPVPARAAEPERLAAARELLGEPVGELWLGAYRLLTDARGAELAGYLDGVARRLEPAYRARFGVRPRGRPLETVALFWEAADYEAYQQADGIAGFRSSGHTAHGVVATYLEGRPRSQVAATLVHELTHLLNRRALGPALPSWLDEGLADDLAQSAIDERGHLRPGVLGGESSRLGDRIEWTGGVAAAIQLRRQLDRGDLPFLSEVLALDWRDFVAAGRNQTHYALCSFLVRYLLRDEAPRDQIGFRTFLADVASGRPATAEALLERLETDWPRLEASFRLWLAGQAPAEWVAEAEPPT